MRKLTSWLSGRYVRLGLAVAAAAAAAPSMAAAAYANLSVTGTVTNTCSINDATLIFPSGSITSPTITAPAVIDFKCTNGLAATITPQAGSNNIGANQWQMKAASGSSAVTFSLYRDDGTTTFEPGSGIDVTGNGGLQTITIMGSIAQGAFQYAPAGAYSATIQLLIAYTP